MGNHNILIQGLINSHPECERVLDSFQKSLPSCALDENLLSIGRFRSNICAKFGMIRLANLHISSSGFQRSLRPYALEKSSLSIRRVNK